MDTCKIDNVKYYSFDLERHEFLKYSLCTKNIFIFKIIKNYVVLATVAI